MPGDSLAAFLRAKRERSVRNFFYARKAYAKQGPWALNRSLVFCHNIRMREILPAALFAIVSICAPLCASDSAFQDLSSNSGPGSASLPLSNAQPARADGFMEAEQYLPPDNNAPGFEWPEARKGLDNFFYIGNSPAFLKASASPDENLSEGAGKCALTPNTLYKASSKPGFEGEHMIVTLAEPLPGCQLTRGYIYMTHVSSSSAGGAWELPKTVRAFMDTLAFAEGTRERYNYIFGYVAFNSYADHPRKVVCSGGLCSTAAGRYQFLARTWDGLVPGLGLTDFTPPSQDKAGLELIRRAGAYDMVLKSSEYENFTAALGRLNTIWASLPGSPYGQPTHPAAELWEVYKAALAKY